VPILFQSNVGKGFNPSPFVPPVTRARTLLFGFIQVIQLKLDSESLKRYPGPILLDIVSRRNGESDVHCPNNYKPKDGKEIPVPGEYDVEQLERVSA
jgi:hypothetical protein